MTRAFNVWFGSLLVITIFTPISVLWLDKPIALFVHDTLNWRISGGVANLPILSASSRSRVGDYQSISISCLLLLLTLWACGKRACVVHHVHSVAVRLH